LQSQASFTQQSLPDSLFLQFSQAMKTKQNENAGGVVLDNDTKDKQQSSKSNNTINSFIQEI